MIVNTSDFIAAIGVCIGIVSGLYALTIVPLEKDMEKVKVSVSVIAQLGPRTHLNTETLLKQDTRLAHHSVQIQQGEVNAAKREVQMEHLTNAIKELTGLLKDMNKGGG